MVNSRLDTYLFAVCCSLLLHAPFSRLGYIIIGAQANGIEGGDLNQPAEPNDPYRYVIDSGKPLSRSLLWTMQRRYFEDQGVEAWSTNIVPSYITSNPFIARSPPLAFP